MKKDKRTNKIPVLHRNLMTDKHEPPKKKTRVDSGAQDEQFILWGVVG